MPTCLIGLGSNLGDRQSQLEIAVQSLSKHPQIQIWKQSSWYETAPVGGPSGQGAFLNGAVRLETSLRPEQLWNELRTIEKQAGREKKQRWDARILDLDLLLYGEKIISTEEITVPHPRMIFRRFVLEPAFEVGAYLLHPQTKWTIAQLLTHLNQVDPYLAVTCGVPQLASIVASQIENSSAVLSNQEQEEPWLELSSFGKTASVDSLSKQLHQRIALLSSELDWKKHAFYLSDFWLDDLKVLAKVLFPDDQLKTFEREWDSQVKKVSSPKYLFYLNSKIDDLVRLLNQQPPENTQRSSSSKDLLLQYQTAFAAYATSQQKVPVIEIDIADEAWAVHEISAAIQAMK